MSKASFRFGWVAALLLSGLLLKVKAQPSTAQTDCVEGTLFTVIRGDNSNFDQAVSKCSALDPPNKSVLAAIRNAAHFDAVVAILDSSEDRYWIGLKDPNGKAGDGNKDTSRFEYVAEDQTGISGFIDVGSGNAPWNGGQPNNVGGNEDCGAFFQFGSDFFFGDDECSRPTSYVCSSDCGSSPTTSPTNPTISPTNPTRSPTPPTRSPTRSVPAKNESVGPNFSFGDGIILTTMVVLLLIVSSLGYILKQNVRKLQELEVENLVFSSI